MSNIFIADNCLSVDLLKQYEDDRIFLPDIIYYEIIGIKFPYEYHRELSNVIINSVTIIHTEKANIFCELMRVQKRTNKNMMKYDLVTEATLEALEKVTRMIKGETLYLMGSNSVVFDVLGLSEQSFLNDYKLIDLEKKGH